MDIFQGIAYTQKQFGLSNTVLDVRILLAVKPNKCCLSEHKPGGLLSR